MERDARDPTQRWSDETVLESAFMDAPDTVENW